MACECRPGLERMREHVHHGPGGRWESTALLTSCAGTRGGGRKRKKRPSYKCGFCPCYGIKRRIGASPTHTQAGTDCGRVSRLSLFKAKSRRDNEIVCAVRKPSSKEVCSFHHCDKTRLSKAHCDKAGYGFKHSSCKQRRNTPAFRTNAEPSLRAWSVLLPHYTCKREFLLSLLALWFASHVLQLTSTSFVAQAAAVPSPPFLSSSSTPFIARYKLVPVSNNNDRIFIYFNPPSILNLKVNTRQSVYFNFTLYRPSGFSPISTSIKKVTDDDITPTNNNNHANKTATNRGSTKHQKGHLDTPMNDDAAGGSATTTKTATTTGTSFGNNNHSHPASSSTSQPLPTSTDSDSTPSSSKRNSNSNASNSATKASQEDTPEENGSSYWVMIYSDDDNIARPVIPSPNGLAAAKADSRGSYILMAVSAGRQHNFSVEARHIGRVTMSVAVVDVNGDRRMPQASYVQAVAASQYPVTAVRGERTADLVFNISAAAIAIIISFGIGAVTDTDSLKRQLKYPVALIIGFCCQFVIMPVMAFGMAMLLPVDKDIRFGLLCVACVPGGGLSHVAVIIADGDTALSVTMNLIGVVAMLGTAPLWIFVLGQYFQTDSQAVLNPRMIPIYNFEIWLASAFLAYIAGLVIKRLKPAVADAILMWLIKPFLLLASILYITLGVYINMYVFELVNGYALLGAMLLPLCGCIVGGVLAAICRQNYTFIKTIALESSSLNCLIVMVALRFSLKQPDADLAAVIPIWVMFTIPGFFVFLALCNKVKNVILGFWRSRNNKDNDIQNSSKAYSVSSSVVSPPGTTTLSAPLVVADGMDDDATISTMSNQKVTVL